MTETTSDSPNQDEQVRQAALANWRSVAIEQSNRSDIWGLEALRNLILLNAAGLAGTITAYQISAIQRGTWPAILFLSGIALAFVAIAFGWIMHRMAARQYANNFQNFEKTGDPRALFVLNMPALKKINAVSIVTGVLSFGGFVGGAWTMIDLVK